MWTDRTLADHIGTLSGFAFSSDYFNGDGDGLPLIRIRDINSVETQIHYSGPYPAAFVVSEGDILVGMDGEFNLKRWRGDKALLNQRVLKVFAKSNGEIDLGFAYYWLGPFLKKVEAATAATTVKHLSSKDVERAVIHSPDKDEQATIARILSALDTQIEATKKLISKQERVRAGLMQDLFTRGVDEHGQLRPPRDQAPQLYHQTELGWLPLGWEVQPFGKRIDVIDPNPSHRYPDETVEGVPICSTENFEGSDDFDVSFAKNVTEATFRFQNNRCNYHPLDVVFARKGRIGLARRYGHDRKVFSHTVVTMKPLDTSVIRSWVLWLVRSNPFLSGIAREMNSNSGVPTLGIEFIKSISVPFPLKHEQLSMSSILDAISSSIAIQEADLAKLRLQKSGLMQDLLTGTVSVAPLLETQLDSAAA